jgi:hypothetical protein
MEIIGVLEVWIDGEAIFADKTFRLRFALS